MENNILSAQEWLKKEEVVGEWKSTSDPSLSILIERYSNYKTKELMGLIFDFRNKIILNGGLTNFTILKKFDKHFKIEKVTNEK